MSETAGSPTATTPLALEPCRICGASRWSALYHGPVRTGTFGVVSDGPRDVWRCGDCGAGWLPGEPIDYRTDDYRTTVDGHADADNYYRVHDREQASKLDLVGAERLRRRVIADVGCGAGSFLDLASGLASATLAIEPAESFHAELSRKGHVVCPFAAATLPEWRGRVDLAVSFSVIEHVDDPVQFLRDIRALLRPGGEALVSTPNRNDWLIELLPQDYAPFFYRKVHRWYFDALSLGRVAEIAGFQRTRTEHVHRFDLANLVVWLRDRRPSGTNALPVPPAASAALTATLEATGRADYLYMWMEG